MRGRIDIRCFGAGWVAGWAVAVFLPSVLIAYAQGPGGSALKRLAADSWHVADEMAPGAKLLLGALLAVGFFGVERLARRPGGATFLLCAVAGVAAMLLTLLLIPADWSRGFGVGLAGERLPPKLLPFYLVGAAAAGLVHAFTAARCRAKLGRA